MGVEVTGTNTAELNNTTAQANTDPMQYEFLVAVASARAAADKSAKPDVEAISRSQTEAVPQETSEAQGQSETSGNDGSQGNGETKPYTVHQADADAQTIHEATDGGLVSTDTGKRKIWRVLEGKTSDQIDMIRRSYQKYFNKNLDARIREKLAGRDLKHTEALLKGPEHQADAAAIRIKIEQGRWDVTHKSNERILRILENASPNQRHEIAEAYFHKYGGTGATPEEALLSKLNFTGTDLERAQNLLAVHTAKSSNDTKKFEAQADAGRLWAARGATELMGRPVTANIPMIKETLAGKSRDQIEAIDAALQAKHGRSLQSFLVEVAGSNAAERDVLLRLANPPAAGDEKAKAEASAERIAEAGSHFWSTDRAAVDRELAGKSQTEIKAITDAFKNKNNGAELKDFLSRLASGDGERDTWTRMLNPPAEGDTQAQTEATAERVRRAVNAGDANALRREFGDKSKPEIDVIAAAYEKKYNSNLRKDLKSTLSHRDRREIVKQLFDKGGITPNDPNALQKRIDRLRELQKKEKSWGQEATSFVQNFRHDGVSDRHWFKDHLDRAQKALDRGDKAEAERLLNIADGDLGAMRQSKDKFVDYATEAATTVASVAVPGGVFIRMAAAGITATGTYSALQGQNADPSEAGRRGALGSTSAIGPRGLPKGAPQTFWSVTKQGAKDGAIQSGTYGALDTATRQETWNDGIWTGMRRVGLGGLEGTVEGIVIGGPTGGALHAGGKAVGQTAAAPQQATKVESAPSIGGNAGHPYANEVFPGGSGRAYAGHGGLRPDAGEITVPEGTAITVPRDNIHINDHTGRYIERGDWEGLARAAKRSRMIRDDTTGMTTYLPGARIPNYSLAQPERLSIYSRSATVAKETQLSDLLKPNMGCVNWAACTKHTKRALTEGE